VRKLFAAANIRTESLPFTTRATGTVPVDAFARMFLIFGTIRMTAHPPTPLPELTRRVGWNALLWTAGNLLTTGGFLTYFVREYRPPGVVMTVLLVIPETAAILGLSTPWILAWTGDRRRMWWVGQVVARSLTLCTPVVCAILGPRDAAWAGWATVGLVGVAAVAQSVSFNALFSWLADLAPRERWGRFFATRQVIQVGLLLCLAAPAGALRDWVGKAVPVEDRWLIYAPLFALGAGLQLVALAPLWSLRDAAVSSRGMPKAAPSTGHVDVFGNPIFVRWLLANWWLAFFSGLTQAAFFKYRVDVLSIGLGTWYLLEAVLRGVQIPVGLLAGRMSDRGRDLAAFRLGVAGTGLALVFMDVGHAGAVVVVVRRADRLWDVGVRESGRTESDVAAGSAPCERRALGMVSEWFGTVGRTGGPRRWVVVGPGACERRGIDSFPFHHPFHGVDARTLGHAGMASQRRRHGRGRGSAPGSVTGWSAFTTRRNSSDSDRSQTRALSRRRTGKRSDE
jgi:hypothetical protein